MDRYDVIVVGGGVAAGACVTTLREELAYEGSILVACEEPVVPYTRPGLTKQVLRGEKPESAAEWRPRSWYDEHDVTLRVGEAVTHVDRAAGTVRIGGADVEYGQLVLATGAQARRLPAPAEVADRVHAIRTLRDAAQVRPHLGPGTRWGVVGGGFIGAEFAASARLTGSEVVLVMPESVPMERALGSVVGGWIDARLRDQGVEMLADVGLDRIDAQDGRPVLVLDDGTREVVDQVVVGIGVEPSVALATQCELELAAGGVAVDEALRTSDPRIFAIGDVAAWTSRLHGGDRLRVEHWETARAHGEHVARVIASGDAAPFMDVPYFFSTLGTWAFVEHVHVGSGSPVVRGSLDEDTLSVAFVDDEDRLVALTVVGRGDDLKTARATLAERPHVDRQRLADPAVSLEDALVDASGARP